MGILIQLAIYAALAGALWFGAHKAWDGFVDWVSEPRVRAQVVADTVVLEQVKTERDAAQKQAADAMTDVQACVSTSNVQSAKVKQWQDEASRLAGIAAKAKAAGAAEHQVAQTAIQRYQAIASAPPVKDQTCQQKLDATDKLLRDAARARAAAKAGK